MGLSEILANPDSDDARAVYADELVERGDPRGELIQLQLAGERVHSDWLLDRHGKQWFPWNAHIHVRRGFVDAVSTSHRVIYEAIAAVEPVTQLETDDLPSGDATRRLRALAITRLIGANDIFEVGQFMPGVRDLSCLVHTLDEEAVDVLLDLGLERLFVRTFTHEPAALARLVAAPFTFLGLNVPLDLVAAAGPIRAPEIALEGFGGGRAAELARILDPIRPRALRCDLDARSAIQLASWPGLATIEELKITSAPLGRASLPRVRRFESYETMEHIDAPLVRELHNLPAIRVERVLELAELETLVAQRIDPSLAARAPARLTRVAPDPSRRWADFRRYAWTG
jgi:uncharacterized protein (TIGR02996 family)